MPRKTRRRERKRLNNLRRLAHLLDGNVWKLILWKLEDADKRPYGKVCKTFHRILRDKSFCEEYRIIWNICQVSGCVNPTIIYGAHQLFDRKYIKGRYCRYHTCGCCRDLAMPNEPYCWEHGMACEAEGCEHQALDDYGTLEIASYSDHPHKPKEYCDKHTCINCGYGYNKTGRECDYCDKCTRRWEKIHPETGY